MTPKQRLKSKALKLWYSKYLKDSCEICPSTFVLQAHHFYFRSSYPQLAFSKDNHITLCRGHHFLLHTKDAKKIEEQIIEKRGKKWYNRLKKESQKPIIPGSNNAPYLKKIIKELEK